jgi:hypothetical protein
MKHTVALKDGLSLDKSSDTCLPLRGQHTFAVKIIWRRVSRLTARMEMRAGTRTVTVYAIPRGASNPAQRNMDFLAIDTHKPPFEPRMLIMRDGYTVAILPDRQESATTSPLFDSSIMRKPAAAPNRMRMIWTLAFVLSFLFTQFAGQQHRIEHAQWLSGANPATQFQGGGSHYPANHSCVTFDACALAFALGLAIVLALAIAGKHLPATWIARDSWHAPFVHLFLSRAPPAAS